MEPTPFTVIGGFLGAGKTTLINHLLTSSRRIRYAVLVNDFGSINIDASLIREHNGTTMALANGCICCSLANGFIEVMIRLMKTRNLFDHIIVEASGVSDPDRIMDFARIDSELTPDATLVLIDSLNFLEQYEDPLLKDTLLRQAQSADLFLLNKMESTTPEKHLDIEKQLCTINPDAAILPLPYKDIPFELIIGNLISPEERSSISPETTDQHNFKSIAFQSFKIISEADFHKFVEGLSPKIIRGKGFIRLSRGNIKWHLAGKKNSSTTSEIAHDKSQIVLISAHQEAMEQAQKTAQKIFSEI